MLFFLIIFEYIWNLEILRLFKWERKWNMIIGGNGDGFCEQQKETNWNMDDSETQKEVVYFYWSKYTDDFYLDIECTVNYTQPIYHNNSGVAMHSHYLVTCDKKKAHQ